MALLADPRLLHSMGTIEKLATHRREFTEKPDADYEKESAAVYTTTPVQTLNIGRKKAGLISDRGLKARPDVGGERYACGCRAQLRSKREGVPPLADSACGTLPFTRWASESAAGELPRWACRMRLHFPFQFVHFPVRVSNHLFQRFASLPLHQTERRVHVNLRTRRAQVKSVSAKDPFLHALHVRLGREYCHR